MSVCGKAVWRRVLLTPPAGHGPARRAVAVEPAVAEPQAAYAADRQQVIRGESGNTVERSIAPAEGQPCHPDATGRAGHRCLARHGRRGDQRVRCRASRDGRDVDGLHSAEVDDQSAMADRPTGPVTTGIEHRQRQARSPGLPDCLAHLTRVAASPHRRRTRGDAPFQTLRSPSISSLLPIRLRGCRVGRDRRRGRRR